MNIRNTTQHRHWARRLVYLQIALQTGMAMAPFYTATVKAAVSPFSTDRIANDSAQHASAVAQAAQDGNLNGFAAQQASGMASREMQQWLQNFGTARVELGTDNKFKPVSGSVDLLVPLFKSEERLIFTQNGIRNKDGQFTGNFGVGQRHFMGDWMFGYNAFYDQNFSQSHKRVGTGLEFWRDYMKLSSNGYLRTSGWKNAGDLEDYDARPANGFDIRAEAWLPAYPSLGGRLMYEQYYGDEVALFSKDKRQRNPDAVTAGLNWTPVPLISFTADHKKGGGQSESTFGMQLSWQLGQSLAAQLDSDSVGAKRTLAGSGMDLVERNNNIVLEYRKHQLIELTLPKGIVGQSGSTQPINYTLKTKYNLAKIIWNDAAIVAAGGKVEALDAGRYQVILPKYVPGSTNTHILSGVAYDVRGNASKVASTQIIVTSPVISAINSTVAASQNTILADGRSTAQILISLRDEQNLPVTGMAANITASVKEQIEEPATVKNVKTAQAPAQPAQLSEITEQENGTYLITLTAGTRPATAIITAAIEKITLPAVTVTQVSDTESAAVKDGDLKLMLNNVIANGKSESKVQAYVTDAIGNSVAGVAVTFSLSGSAKVSTGSNLSGVSDAKGYVNLAFTNTVAEVVTVKAETVNGGNASVEATFVADSANAELTNGSLNADRLTAVADGKDKITYSVKVQDAHANPVSGMAVAWNTDGGNLSSASSITDNSGVATIGLTNTLAQQVTVGASLNNTVLNAPVVSFIGDAGDLDPLKSTLTAAPVTIVADGTATSTITLDLKDSNGNPVTAQTVAFVGTLPGTTISNTVDNNDGTYTALLSGTIAGNDTISAKIGGGAFAVSAAQVTLTADASKLDASKSSLNAAPAIIVANGTAASVLTLSLKDINNNPVTGQSVTFNSTLAGSKISSTTDNGDGSYTAKLTGTTAGRESVTVNIAGSSFAVTAAVITLTADSSNLDAGKSVLSASPTTIVANGADTSVVVLILKDANDNPVSGQNVVFASSLTGSAMSDTTDNGDGSYSSSLTGIKSGSTNISVSVAGTNFAVTGSSVSLTADSTTAKIASITSDKSEVTGTGTETATLSAVVTDANENILSDYVVSWATTQGVITASSNSDASGKATATLTAPVNNEATNGTAIVTATAVTSKSTSVAVRAVMQVGGQYFWTMTSSHNTSSESEANRLCNLYGGGRVIGRSDVAVLVNGGGDFANQNVPGEYKNVYYYLAGEWSTYTADLSSESTGLGAIHGIRGSFIPVAYACTK